MIYQIILTLCVNLLFSKTEASFAEFLAWVKCHEERNDFCPELDTNSQDYRNCYAFNEFCESDEVGAPNGWHDCFWYKKDCPEEPAENPLGDASDNNEGTNVENNTDTIRPGNDTTTDVDTSADNESSTTNTDTTKESDTSADNEGKTDDSNKDMEGNSFESTW